MESEDNRKLNDDMVAFVSKRSKNEAPRYTARLKAYVNIQHKRRRATAARRNSERGEEMNTSRKNVDGEQNAIENTEQPSGGAEEGRMSRKRGDKCMHRTGSRSGEPSDRCCRRKRRRRRRRSCRRRRRSCSRRRRRRRRRSCSRRRRRRSCRRRRRRRYRRRR